MTKAKTYTVYYEVVTTYKATFTATENPGTNTSLYEAFEDMVHDVLSNRKDVVTEDINYDSISVVERDY